MIGRAGRRDSGRWSRECFDRVLCRSGLHRMDEGQQGRTINQIDWFTLCERGGFAREVARSYVLRSELERELQRGRAPESAETPLA